MSYLSAQKVRLMTDAVRLVHLQSNVSIELGTNFSSMYIGKPNNVIIPEIDISKFPASDIVSRIHAEIWKEDEAYFIEDLDSKNGTYINQVPLAPGTCYQLNASDRISLGGGDLVTFIFELF